MTPEQILQMKKDLENLEKVRKKAREINDFHNYDIEIKWKSLMQ